MKIRNQKSEEMGARGALAGRRLLLFFGFLISDFEFRILSDNLHPWHAITS